VKVYHGSYMEINEMEATAVYYKSKTYSQLSEPTVGLYKKDWMEIYEMLKNELQLRK
jgi:hypothetical protein